MMQYKIENGLEESDYVSVSPGVLKRRNENYLAESYDAGRMHRKHYRRKMAAPQRKGYTAQMQKRCQECPSKEKISRKEGGEPEYKKKG